MNRLKSLQFFLLFPIEEMITLLISFSGKMLNGIIVMTNNDKSTVLQFKMESFW